MPNFLVHEDPRVLGHTGSQYLSINCLPRCESYPQTRRLVQDSGESEAEGGNGELLKILRSQDELTEQTTQFLAELVYDRARWERAEILQRTSDVNPGSTQDRIL
jgi:hypothetical protein